MQGERQQDLFRAGPKWKKLNELELPQVVRLSPRVSISACKIVAVLRCLQSFAGESVECWPSARTVSERTRIPIPSVRRALRAAEQLALIERLPRRVDGHQASNRYRFVWSNFAPERDDQTAEQVITVIRAGDHGDRAGDHHDQGKIHLENYSNTRPVGGDLNFDFLGEIEERDMDSVEGVDQVFRKFVRKGRFGFDSRLRHRFEFHCLWAATVRAYLTGKIHKPKGCFFGRIRRGRENWRPFIKRIDRKRVRKLWKEALCQKSPS